jgi:hypothetical protein
LRLGREVTRAVGSLLARSRVGRNDCEHPTRARTVITARFGKLHEPLLCFDCGRRRARIPLDVPRQRCGRGGSLPGILIELGRSPERFLLDVVGAWTFGDALELRRRAHDVTGLHVRDG